MDEQKPEGIGLDTGIPPYDPSCPECAKRLAETEMTGEMNLAILIALMPVMVFTLINFTGLV